MFNLSSAHACRVENVQVTVCRYNAALWSYYQSFLEEDTENENEVKYVTVLIYADISPKYVIVLIYADISPHKVL